MQRIHRHPPKPLSTKLQEVNNDEHLAQAARHNLVGSLEGTASPIAGVRRWTRPLPLRMGVSLDEIGRKLAPLAQHNETELIVPPPGLLGTDNPTFLEIRKAHHNRTHVPWIHHIHHLQHVQYTNDISHIAQMRHTHQIIHIQHMHRFQHLPHFHRLHHLRHLHFTRHIHHMHHMRHTHHIHIRIMHNICRI